MSALNLCAETWISQLSGGQCRFAVAGQAQYAHWVFLQIDDSDLAICLLFFQRFSPSIKLGLLASLDLGQRISVGLILLFLRESSDFGVVLFLLDAGAINSLRLDLSISVSLCLYSGIDLFLKALNAPALINLDAQLFRLFLEFVHDETSK